MVSARRPAQRQRACPSVRTRRPATVTSIVALLVISALAGCSTGTTWRGDAQGETLVWREVMKWRIWIDLAVFSGLMVLLGGLMVHGLRRWRSEPGERGGIGCVVILLLLVPWVSRDMLGSLFGRREFVLDAAGVTEVRSGSHLDWSAVSSCGIGYSTIDSHRYRSMRSGVTWTEATEESGVRLRAEGGSEPVTMYLPLERESHSPARIRRWTDRGLALVFGTQNFEARPADRQRLLRFIEKHSAEPCRFDSSAQGGGEPSPSD